MTSTNKGAIKEFKVARFAYMRKYFLKVVPVERSVSSRVIKESIVAPTHLASICFVKPGGMVNFKEGSKVTLSHNCGSHIRQETKNF